MVPLSIPVAKGLSQNKQVFAQKPMMQQMMQHKSKALNSKGKLVGPNLSGDILSTRTSVESFNALLYSCSPDDDEVS